MTYINVRVNIGQSAILLQSEIIAALTALTSFPQLVNQSIPGMWKRRQRIWNGRRLTGRFLDFGIFDRQTKKAELKIFITA